MTRFAFRLAAKLGRPDVRRMLRQMSWREFEEWMAFVELEPLERDTYQLALIAQLLANVNRDTTKRPRPFELKDFVLRFDAGEREVKQQLEQRQSVEYQMMVLDGWIAIQNARVAQGLDNG